MFIWFTNLFKLHKIEFEKPELNVKIVDKFTNNNSVKIDLSLLKRYTDEHQTHDNMIFVRTDYLDKFRHFKKGSFNKMEVSLKTYDHFRVSTSRHIKYDLRLDGKNSDEEPLRFFLWNIFLQNNENLKFKTLRFREGLLPIIANALARNDTIGLLPAGAGNSVCYQFAAILQPAISFVVLSD